MRPFTISIKCLLLGLTLLLVHSFALYSQTREELEKQRREAETVISNTNRLLQEVGVTRQSNLERLTLINQRLESRQTLVRNIEIQIRMVNDSISENSRQIRSLELQLEEALEAYANLVRIAYRHRSSHFRFMFILSADSFNQSYRRLRYLQQYGKSRQNQLKLIESINLQLKNEAQTMEFRKNELSILLQTRINEVNLLALERTQQTSLVRNLQNQETQLKQQLEQQRKVAASLQNAIEALLKAESDATDGVFYALTPADRIISTQFAENRGVLPWPTERGVVTGFFGEHNHPVLRGIKIQNNGIDITTVENAEVRAVFDGVVRQVLTVPGSNNVVLIRHGNYLSVYSNLSQVYVRAGDRVTTKQLIGRVFSDPDSNNSTILHLEIWEESKKLDPMLWLSRQ